MTRVRRKSHWTVISTLLIIGICSAALAFWLVDHRHTIPDSGWVIGFSMGACLVCFTWALLRFIAWRDRLVANTRVPSVNVFANGGAQNLAGTIYALVPEAIYQVQQEFTDYYGNHFQQGERLRFKQRHFLPYDGGHTVLFAERPLYLQENRNAEILDNFSQYLERISS